MSETKKKTQQGASAKQQSASAERSKRTEQGEPKRFNPLEEARLEQQRQIWQLKALGPLDGRYHDIAEELSPIFSEYALIRWRVWAEVKWLIYQLTELEWTDTEAVQSETADFAYRQNYSVTEYLGALAEGFSPEDALVVKEIESTTNHDVKACEIWLDIQLENAGLKSLRSFVHFGLTSEDVNSVAYAQMSLLGRNLLASELRLLIGDLDTLARHYVATPMLAHTHGQPASPTTFGKELAVYALRLGRQLERINATTLYCKFSGATGTNAAFQTMIDIADSREDINGLSSNFIDWACGFGIADADVTTQIEPHDYIARLLNNIKLAGQIIRDLDLDMWTYISMEYLKQNVVKAEVGSSTMPHKVNPITFENSEANTKVLTGLCNALADELPRSRMQRDLSDSSLLRNLGLVFGYALQAIRQTRRGLLRVSVNTEKMRADLEAHPEVLAEPIQTVLRARGVFDAYDRLKTFTRGQAVTLEELRQFVLNQPELTEEDKKYLVALTPANYIGNAEWQVGYAARQVE